MMHLSDALSSGFGGGGVGRGRKGVFGLFCCGFGGFFPSAPVMGSRERCQINIECCDLVYSS